jgi:hypothetical protein
MGCKGLEVAAKNVCLARSVEFRLGSCAGKAPIEGRLSGKADGSQSTTVDPSNPI